MRYQCLAWMRDEEGMATVEYAMLLAVVVVAAIGAWVGLTAKIRSALTIATNSISEPFD